MENVHTALGKYNIILPPEALTAGRMIPSGTNGPPAEISTQ